MRFFKAFNILHRRTKSATFVSGPPLDHLASTRLSSSSYVQIPTSPRNDGLNASIFDFVTSIVPAIPPQFNHLADATSSFWHPRRNSSRTSMASFQSTIDKEHSRLKEAVVFWSQEHSKLRSILTNYHADLVAERQKNMALEHKADLDAQVILDLRSRLAQRTTSTTEADSVSGYHDAEKDARLIDPVITVTSESSPTRLPTIEEYSSALRLTLATRKELRDQKKVTKFWKRHASSSVEKHIITPSASTISSIHEPLPAERQTALHALLMRRGLTSKLAGLVKYPLSEINCSESSSRLAAEAPLSFDVVLRARLPTMDAALPPSHSRGSADSRLPPLASESLKAEINLLFGLRDSSKLLSPLSHKGRSLSASIPLQDVPKKLSPGKALVSEAHPPSSSTAESCSSGITLLANTTEIETSEVDHGTYDQTSILHGLASWSSSFMHSSAIPSGSSQTFGQELPVVSQYLKSATPNASVKPALKDCTPRRSWQQYNLTKSDKPNGPIGFVQPPARQAASKMEGQEKENMPFSKTLPVFRKGHSRLPVPTFARNGC